VKSVLGAASVSPMPFTHSFHVDPTAFVLLRARDAVNLIMWANAMRQVIADRTFGETMPILLDLTEATWAAQQPDETVIVARTWRLLAPRSRGAIIAREFGMALQVQQQSAEHVRAFPDLQAAVQWLSGSALGDSSVSIS
jgi:hypothetical protein